MTPNIFVQKGGMTRVTWPPSYSYTGFGRQLHSVSLW